MARPDDAYLALLDLASATGTSLNETKVAKLLYLADLRAHRAAGGRAASGLRWFWHNHGPWDTALPRVRAALVAARRVTQERLDLSWEVFERTVRLARPLEPAERSDLFARLSGFDMHLLAVLNEFGHLSASSLRDYTYDTAPMRRVQTEGARGAFLDMSALHEDDDQWSVEEEAASPKWRDALSRQRLDGGRLRAMHRELAGSRSLAEQLLG